MSIEPGPDGRRYEVVEKSPWRCAECGSVHVEVLDDLFGAGACLACGSDALERDVVGVAR